MTPEKESDTATSPASIFPQLVTGKLHKRSVDYKNGARYHGDVCENRRSGYGHFSWPNGAHYEGEFVDNLRHGEGIPHHSLYIFILCIHDCAQYFVSQKYLLLNSFSGFFYFY